MNTTKNEQDFHNQVFKNGARKEHDERYYSITHSISNRYDDFLFNNPEGKVFLEYGCGMAEKDRLIELVNKGAVGVGIDISDFAINHLSNRAEKKNLNIVYQVMNAEDMTFPEDQFDVIFGAGILHHLDLTKSYKSISSKLKKTGSAIFIEPLGHNPVINLFRQKTPELRTVNEHPLMMNDLEEAKKYFKNVELRYFYLTTIILLLFFKKSPPKNFINFFDSIDRLIFVLFPFLRKYSWQVLILLSNPK